MPGVVVDARGVRPVGLSGDKIKSLLFDQPLRDPRPHSVKLRSAVACFAYKYDTCVTDALKKGLEFCVPKLGEDLRVLGDQGRYRDVHGGSRTNDPWWFHLPLIFSTFPSLLSDQRHKAYVCYVLLLEIVIARPSNAHELLGTWIVPDGNDHTSADLELMEKNARYVGRACRNQNRIKRRLLRPALCAVGVTHVHMVLARAGEILVGLGSQRADTFDGVDVARDLRQHSCGIT